jgi:hypothetical protein
VWGYVVSYLGTRFDGINQQDVTTIKHFLIDAGSNGYRFFGVDKLTHPSLADLINHHKVSGRFVKCTRVDCAVLTVLVLPCVQ